MHFRDLLAVALAEMRSASRLARTWIFAVVAVLIAVVAGGGFSLIHGLASGFSATAGMIGPRFLISSMGFYLLWLMLVAMIFLAFDVRSRDARERMAEVLDSRPVTNLDLLAGRLLGLVIVAWIPVLVMAALLQAFGLLAANSDLWFGEPLQEVSLASFVFAEMLPSLLLWGAFVMLLTVVLRNRLLVAVVALASVTVPMVLLVSLPSYLTAVATFVALPAQLDSDMVSTSFTARGGAHRLAMLAAAAGFVLLAAALHPRRDGASRGVQVSAGTASVVFGLTVFALLLAAAMGDVDRRQAWGDAHVAHRGEPVSDLRAVSGTATIDPGDGIFLDLALVLTAPAVETDQLLFSLNPGIEVDELRMDGVAVDYRHELGLLTLTPAQTLPPGAPYTLTVRASGAPEPLFGYLDNAVEPLLLTGNDNTLLLLGTDVAIFNRRHVALMPAARWMPYPGANVEPAANSPSRHDYFDLDLEVVVPEGWLVAGPGRRDELSSTRVRFHPPAPVPAFGLVAGRFERRAANIAGVAVEVLLHPGHARNIEVFEEAGAALAERLTEMFEEAQALGLPYPYRGLSLVETPTTLRSFGGGWRMDTVLSLPGLLLMRENSWPTARFDFWFRNREELEAEYGGVPEAKVHALARFFENDMSGGNVVLGAARNFLSFQTGAVGVGADALDFVTETLTARLLTRRDGHFSAFVFASGESLGTVVGATLNNILGDSNESIVDAVANAASNRPSVWDRALGAALADIDPWADPEMALDVITLKGRAIASAIMDGLGRERTAALLAELRLRRGGGVFTAEDFEAAARAVGADLDQIVGDWLRDAALPGFIASGLTVFRLSDDELGEPRYQIRLTVRNGEAAGGLVRLRFTTPDRLERAGEEDEAAWVAGEPIRIAGNSAVDVGLIGNGVPQQLVMEPYLALNRGAVQLELPDIDEETVIDVEPFLGTRLVDWTPADGADIVVDDLDPGFSLVSHAGEGDAARLGGIRLGVPDPDVDQGLPVYQPFAPPAAGWARQAAASAWGRYRHTVSRAGAGEGNQVATFTARLPEAGRWRLDYHLPEMPRRGDFTREAGGGAVVISVSAGGGPAFFGTQGTYDITLASAGSQRKVEFDASVAEPGWNDLGEFDLAAGEVEVAVTNASSGSTVIADAIRWRPARHKGSSGAQ